VFDPFLVTLPAADKKGQEVKKGKGNESDNSDARPKRGQPKGKAPAKPPAKTNGKVGAKSNGRSNGRR
jgi:hypothetical protein